MSQVITSAFEQYWQSCLAAEQPVVLDEFILADIPNLDITSPIDPETGLPPESQIVHRQNVDQRGRINNNAVAYTIVMDTTVGDFSFNAMYLRNKQNGVIGMIVYKGRETKLKTDQTTGQTGNSLVKSMLMGYDQAAEATLTHVDAGTWQIDYAARLRGMDEDLRQLASQLYGHHTFIGDGFKVVEKDGAYQVTKGVAIVGGLRVELKAPEVIHPGTKPIGVWVDVHRAGSLLSEHQNHFTIITSVADLTDHVDSNGYQHYVAKLATVRADGTIEDGRGGAGGGSGGAGAIPDTFALWKRSMAEAGYDLIGQFGTAMTIETADQVVINKEGTDVFAWIGSLPKKVDYDELPNGNWVSVKEITLRDELCQLDGVMSADAEWGDVKAHKSSVVGDVLNEPVRALLARFEFLNSKRGASKIGGATKYFESVADMKLAEIDVGDCLETTGYYVAGDGGGASYVVVDGDGKIDGFGDHISYDGKAIRLCSDPTDLNHGVKVRDYFDASEAWHNRNVLQSMLRNERWNVFELLAKGRYYVLGSIHPNRDDIKIDHHVGCYIVGRYESSVIPESDLSQGGHMFGFCKFANPDVGDFTVVGTTKGVVYRLDGDVSTEYDVNHSKRHNNNCIGFFNSDGCAVYGAGGVSGSDHRGVVFDGLARNCHIDIAYAKKTMDEPAVMKGASGTSTKCTVKIGRVSEVSFGGPNEPIVVRVQDGPNTSVEIGSFEWDGFIKPQLVGAFNAGTVEVFAGLVNGASQLLRQYDTLDSSVVVSNVLNTPLGIVRAGVVEKRMRSARLSGVKYVDSSFVAAYKAESNVDGFGLLSIVDNNFAAAATAFRYYMNKATVGLPSRFKLIDNISPVGFSPVGGELNAYTSGVSSNFATGGPSVAINYKSPDWVFGFLTFVVSVDGVSYMGDVNLRVRDMTSVDLLHNAGGVVVKSKRDSGVLTLEVASGSFQMAFMHN